MADETKEPLVLVAARKEAEARGVGAEQVLAEDRVRAEQQDFPTEECFFPEEVEDVVALERGDAVRLSSLRTPGWLFWAIEHHKNCLFCRIIVSSMRDTRKNQNHP